MNLGDSLQDDREEHGSEKRRLQGSLIVVFYHLIGTYEEDKDFMKVPDKSHAIEIAIFVPGIIRHIQISVGQVPKESDITFEVSVAMSRIIDSTILSSLSIKIFFQPPIFFMILCLDNLIPSCSERTADVDTELCMGACILPVWKLKNGLNKWTPNELKIVWATRLKRQ